MDDDEREAEIRKYPSTTVDNEFLLHRLDEARTERDQQSRVNLQLARQIDVQSSENARLRAVAEAAQKLTNELDACVSAGSQSRALDEALRALRDALKETRK